MIVQAQEPPLEDKGPDAFDTSNLVMTFLNNLGVRKILHSFRLVLEGKSRVIKLRVLGKIFSKQFCFIRCRRQHHRIINYRKYSIFTFVENTTSNSLKVTRARFLESDGLFCFIKQVSHLQETFCNDY